MKTRQRNNTAAARQRILRRRRRVKNTLRSYPPVNSSKQLARQSGSDGSQSKTYPRHWEHVVLRYLNRLKGLCGVWRSPPIPKSQQHPFPGNRNNAMNSFKETHEDHRKDRVNKDTSIGPTKPPRPSFPAKPKPSSGPSSANYSTSREMKRLHSINALKSFVTTNKPQGKQQAFKIVQSALDYGIASGVLRKLHGSFRYTAATEKIQKASKSRINTALDDTCKMLIKRRSSSSINLGMGSPSEIARQSGGSSLARSGSARRKSPIPFPNLCGTPVSSAKEDASKSDSEEKPPDPGHSSEAQVKKKPLTKPRLYRPRRSFSRMARNAFSFKSPYRFRLLKNKSLISQKRFGIQNKLKRLNTMKARNRKIFPPRRSKTPMKTKLAKRLIKSRSLAPRPRKQKSVTLKLGATPGRQAGKSMTLCKPGIKDVGKKRKFSKTPAPLNVKKRKRSTRPPITAKSPQKDGRHIGNIKKSSPFSNSIKSKKKDSSETSLKFDTNNDTCRVLVKGLDDYQPKQQIKITPSTLSSYSLSGSSCTGCSKNICRRYAELALKSSPSTSLPTDRKSDEYDTPTRPTSGKLGKQCK